MSLECEHLIRHMLVRDPVKRYTVSQVQHHRWMTESGVVPVSGDPVYIEPVNEDDEVNEDVLRMVEALKLDREKTIQVNDRL